MTFLLPPGIKGLKFRKDTILLLYTCAHMAEKSPLRVVCLAQHAGCFIQSSLVENAIICERRFLSLLEVLYIKNQITNSSTEDTKKEFTDFIRVAVNQNRDIFMQCDKPSDDVRLDNFYGKFLHQKNYVNLVQDLKKILTCHMAKASAERGFSVNKILLVDSLSVISLVSRRVVHDRMNANNLRHTLEITVPLSRHIRSSRQG